MTLPNFLSFLRIPLAFLFLSESVEIRCFAIFGAMSTDFFDGYLARKSGQITKLGTLLDPISDKFFMAFALFTFFSEGSLTPFEVIAMLSRDIAVALFGLYLLLNKEFNKFEFQSIWAGKLSTTLQLLVLLLLTLQMSVPLGVYQLFIVLGGLALFELTGIASPPLKD